MTILIQSVKKNAGFTHFEGTCISITPNYIQVCKKTPSAARNRFLGGKVFWNRADAVNGYKSGEMKALINAALEAHT